MPDHAPPPALCPACYAEFLAKVEALEYGLAVTHCPHARALARATVDQHRVVHTVVDGPVTTKEAHRQLRELDRHTAPKSTAVAVSTHRRH